MKNTNLSMWWIGYYFGQNVILHPDTGRWILSGYYYNQIVCQRNIGTPEEDCMVYPISEVRFIFKKINPFLFSSMQNFQWFIKTKALEGYWMNFDTTTNLIFEP